MTDSAREVPSVADVVGALDRRYPRDWAEQWDRVGLVLGEFDHDVTRVLCVVDCVPETVDEALAAGADLIVAHHPLLLKPVSSTTSHSGAIEFKGKWYLAYHTADAVGGGHFRRSVALDRIEWDDSVTPARIRTVVPTRMPQPAPAPTRNIAGAAFAAASNEPIPLQYWIKALNDGVVKASPLPPDLWGTWTANNPKQQWIEYRWSKPVTVNGSRLRFWGDQPAGSGIGVAPPAGWQIDYWDKGWKPVPKASGYGVAARAYQDTAFAPVTTRCLRATFIASSANGTNAGVAVQEWQVLAPKAAAPVVPSREHPIAGCD